MWSIFDIIVLVGGFAVGWFSKDWLIRSYGRTTSFIKRLEVKVKAIREAL